MVKKSVTRLFESLKPVNYRLAIELEPAAKKFHGSVEIQAKRTGRPSQRITLHAKGLKVTHAELIKHDKKSGEEAIRIDRINLHAGYDELRLHAAKMIYPGDYTIKLKFSGRITDPMNGLYPCYFSHDGKDKFLLATQFESHHAREVFPCIDEPEAKAAFDLALTAPKTGSLLSNTPAAKSETKGAKQTVMFETTPVMSTYLLALAYGDIGFKEAKTKRGTLVRTYATPDQVKHTGFALETAVKVLEFYEDYFGIPYPLKKCDMIALPDFASGAMENWGLITYREQAFLVDPKNTSLPTKQYVAMVVAHELAHQWFGNLVTMRWWTDLWLNEGFASWIEYLAVDELFPDWQMWTQFIANEQQPALKLDALDNTHPIEVPINHPDEIRTIFDAISYNKGASVIHMLHGYLGANDFKEGLRHYLKQHEYGNAVTSDLWAALEKASGKPVRKFMHAWTTLPGFPLVSYTQHGQTAKLSQQRFYTKRPDKPDNQHWPVPILGSAKGADSFNTAEASLKAKQPAKINVGQSGFYRTLYDTESLKAITAKLPELEPLDRLGLLADSFEIAKAGMSSAADSLALLSAYGSEDNAAVWDIIAAAISDVKRVMDDETVRAALKPFVRELTAQQLARLGWEEAKSDSHFDKLLRPTILGLSASADEPDVVKGCLERFNSAKDIEAVPADLRGVVFTTAARVAGDEAVFDKLFDFHNNTGNSEDRTTLAAALTAFEAPKLIEKALSQIMTKNVRRQDAMYWLAYSFMNRYAKRTAWDWMRVNWEWLDKELGSDLSFYRTPIYAGRSFSDEAILKEYDEFFEPKRKPALDRSINQGREMMEAQIAWKQRDLNKVLDFLSEN